MKKQFALRHPVCIRNSYKPFGIDPNYFLHRKLYSHCYFLIPLTDFQLKDPPKYARHNRTLLYSLRVKDRLVHLDNSKTSMPLTY